MFWLNHIIVGGVIASEPSVETLNGIEAMMLTLRAIRPLATRKGGQAHRFTVKCYQDIAKYVLAKFPRGSAIVVDGELQEQSMRDLGDGKAIFSAVIVAHRVFSATATPEDAAALSPGYGEAKQAAENSRASQALADAQKDMERRVRQEASERMAREGNRELRLLEPTRVSFCN